MLFRSALYLIKPITGSDLLDAIRKALAGTLVNQTRALPPYPLAEDKAQLPTSDRFNLHILLAEDNVVNRKLAARLLEKQGHRVTVASNGKEALGQLEQEHFDLVLMDVQMPEMNGFDTTAAIRNREKHSGQHIPIIAMTAHAMKGDREHCLEVGMDGYVSKPIQSKELSEEISRIVSASVGGREIPHH